MKFVNILRGFIIVYETFLMTFVIFISNIKRKVYFGIFNDYCLPSLKIYSNTML